MTEELQRLISIGAQMSNLCFNLSQRAWTPYDSPGSDIVRETMEKLYREWDAARRAYVDSKVVRDPIGRMRAR